MSTPAPSRRRAARARLGGAGALLAAVLVVAAALAVAFTMPSGEVAAPTSHAGRVATHAVEACPAELADRGARPVFAAGVAPVEGLGDSGVVRRGSSAGDGAQVDLRRGELAELPGAPGSSVLTADGSVAAGLFGFRQDRVADAGTQAVTPCSAPAPTWWFTGAGAGLDHSSRLLLTNVDQGPAVVDLTVLGPNGEVSTVGTHGLTVAPGQTKRLSLTDVAPQNDEVVVGVTAARGRVVASVADSFSPVAGGEPGLEWLDGRARPSRVVRLAGIPLHATQRTLLVANPSASEAVLTIRVAGPAGTFVPTGLEEQRVPPGAVRTIDLGRQVGAKDAVQVRVRSQVRVLAAVRSVVAGDTAYAPSVAPLSGPAVAPLSPNGGAVQVTAGALPGKVAVTAYDASGAKLATRQLDVPASATVSWSLRKGAYVVVEPLAGRVSGAVVYRGPGVSSVALRPLVLRYLQPAVMPGVGAPGPR